MRAALFCVVIVVATACTNDYGGFRFPKSQAAAETTDAGDAGSRDGATSDR
jgi:hypothetical protein